MTAYDRAQAAICRYHEKQFEAAGLPKWKRAILNDLNRDRLVQFIRRMKRPGEAR